MLTSDDLDQMQADLLAVRDDNPVSVVIRRGNTTLAAQTVRIARSGRGSALTSLAGKEARAGVIILGETDLDIQPDDRLTVDGVVYRVTFIRPNRNTARVAECEAVE